MPITPYAMAIPSDRCSDFQNVAGWLPTYQAQTGNWKGAQAGNGGEVAAEGLVAADAATKTYDAHLSDRELLLVQCRYAR